MGPNFPMGTQQNFHYTSTKKAFVVGGEQVETKRPINISVKGHFFLTKKAEFSTSNCETANCNSAAQQRIENQCCFIRFITIDS